MMRRYVAMLAAAGCLALAGTASAQVEPDKAKLEAAALHMRVLLSALQSKDLDNPLKNALFICLYSNPLGQISDATSKVLAGNKLDPKDPNKILTVMAGVCGMRPGAGGKMPPAGTPKGKPAQPDGR
ncbi:MAG: hypothetical protein ABW164_04135 [Sphingobium sp.]